ncbi:MAG: L-serine ammonia-lyase, iron-sulfur-dependent, subunit alpha [Thermoanaerobacteraceae bacterium]|nr:L-serine ammonia-lyase, iron-sulfur-dependent, subunit alpha [Thermoanaerobacteraceae bacterium]
MYEFKTGNELLNLCSAYNKSIGEITILYEMETSEKSREDILLKMKANLEVMREAALYGLTRDIRSVSGLTGGDAKKLWKYTEAGHTLSGTHTAMAVAKAMAVSEVNASMGRIVAAPTAGSCGIIPGALLTAAEILNSTDDDVINALFTASGVGITIAYNATLSGAEGGCQAECGSAAAMAAAAVTELVGGSPEQALNAAAFSLKAVMGLVCDPVAGLVEIPCVKRNAFGASNALTAADMALAGITSRIPFDEVVEAMYRVGKVMPYELKETAKGGLADTPTGKRIKEELSGK